MARYITHKLQDRYTGIKNGVPQTFDTWEEALYYSYVDRYQENKPYIQMYTKDKIQIEPFEIGKLNPNFDATQIKYILLGINVEDDNAIKKAIIFLIDFFGEQEVDNLPWIREDMVGTDPIEYEFYPDALIKNIDDSWTSLIAAADIYTGIVNEIEQLP